MLLITLLGVPAFSQPSLSLNDCIRIGLEKSDAIKMSKTKMDSAEGRYMEARAGMFPKLNFSFAYTRLNEGPASFSIGTPTKTNPFGINFSSGSPDLFSGKLSLQQPIFTWGKILNSIKQAELGYLLSKEEYRKSEQDFVYNIKTAYYRILLAEEMLKVAENAYNSLLEHIKLTEQMKQSGMVSDYDYLRSKVQLANMEPQLLRAKNGLKLAKYALNNLLGEELNKRYALVDEFSNTKFIDDVNVDSQINFSLSNRPEVRQMEIQKLLAESGMELAKASDKPSVALVANYEYSNSPRIGTSSDRNWNVSVAYTVPLFDGFSAIGKIKQAEAGLKQVEIGKNQLINGIKLEVEQTCLALEESRVNLQSTQKNVEQAKEGFKIAELKYSTGAFTNLDVMDAQVALMQAEMNKTQAVFDYLSALAKLEKALGKDIQK